MYFIILHPLHGSLGRAQVGDWGRWEEGGGGWGGGEWCGAGGVWGGEFGGGA